MASQRAVKRTGNFEHNLEAIEAFLIEADAPQAFDALLDDLTQTVIPNLTMFPGMGRLFSQRTPRSVEMLNGMARLSERLDALGQESELREYVMPPYLLLYANTREAVYLLAIRHQRQLAFDLRP